MSKIKRISSVLLAVLICIGLAACGKSPSADNTGLTPVTVCLDYTPNTNHTGMYVAVQKGYYRDAGLDVSIVQPPENGAVAACAAGQADFAIDFQDLLAPAFASDTPMQVTAVAALLQHNTGCIMTAKASGMDTPKDLMGNDFLTWDSPIELAIMKSVVSGDGGDWSKVRLVPNTVTDEAQDIRINPSHAIWVYYGWGGINAKVNGVDVNTMYFKDIDPVFDYYSPVIVAGNGLIESNPDTVRAFLSATKKGYEYAIANPDEAAQILISGDDTGSLLGCEELVTESQRWMADQYISDAEKWGYIDPARWNGFYNWLNQNGLVDTPLQENANFTNEYLE